jgi:hypothetical protein
MTIFRIGTKDTDFEIKENFRIKTDASAISRVKLAPQQPHKDMNRYPNTTLISKHTQILTSSKVCFLIDVNMNLNRMFRKRNVKQILRI